MNIVEAIQDGDLFRPFLADKDGSVSTWRNWQVALRAIYGMSIRKPRSLGLLKRCTGRTQLAKGGYSKSLIITGRRSGKSRCAAIIGAYEACLAGHESKLAKGEQGYVAICSPTKAQSQIVQKYLKAIFKSSPLLAKEVVDESPLGFDLRNGNRIEIIAGEHRAIRGYTLIAAILDEIAFLGVDPDAKTKSDTELIRAIAPSLDQVGGKLIAITTPYARKGWTYATYEKHFGNYAGKVLVWNCPSRTMNPTLRQSVVDDAIAEDPQSAKCEYLGQFRDDIESPITRDIVERLVVKGRKEILPQQRISYTAFADMSGGGNAKNDDTCLAIGYMQDGVVKLCKLRKYAPPFNPLAVCRDISTILKRYHVSCLFGDAYSKDYIAATFADHHIRYFRSDKNRNGLFAELLGWINSGKVELLDDATLVDQLASLERHVRGTGNDSFQAPRGGRDDVANALAGLVTFAARGLVTVGAFGAQQTDEDDYENDPYREERERTMQLSDFQLSDPFSY
ncbi:MAG TPA: hypothetical protein VGG64_09380 [Pirellulales bacterium]|jgi:hypothetical protein